MAARRDKAERAKNTGAASARQALAVGDNRSARAAARDVLDDAGAGEAAKDEAGRILKAASVDPRALAAGLAVLAIVTALFLLFVHG